MWEGGKTRNREVIEIANMASLMEKFGWDYWTYKQQPPHFLVNLLNYLDTQAEVANKKNK